MCSAASREANVGNAPLGPIKCLEQMTYVVVWGGHVGSIPGG